MEIKLPDAFTCILYLVTSRTKTAEWDRKLIKFLSAVHIVIVRNQCLSLYEWSLGKKKMIKVILLFDTLIYSFIQNSSLLLQLQCVECLHYPTFNKILRIYE